MNADESAFAALGLRPGAGRAEVDAAYRRLMKVHHPDRTGGDARRAIEINCAYTFIRRDRPNPAGRTRQGPVRLRHQPRRSRLPWALVLVAALATGLAAYGDSSLESPGSSRIVGVDWTASAPGPATSAAVASSRFDEPLHSGVIGAAIATAIRFHSDGDFEGAADYGRDCHDLLWQQPNMALFDACAAFEESTLVLSAGNPLADARASNGLAVTARQMAAAGVLFNDTFGADSRLLRIRLQVELALLARLEEMAGPTAP